MTPAKRKIQFTEKKVKFLFNMISSQGGDGGDNTKSKKQIVMKSNEWKFRVTCSGLFFSSIYYVIALQQVSGTIS